MGTTFTPRLNDTGIEGSFYWYSQNPFYQSGYGLPNCTCYAWGRFWEIGDPEGTGANRPALPTGDAGNWYANAGDYDRGTAPKLGAVICWSDNDGGAGHVAIVEQISDNGDIVTSNSAWGGSYFYPNTVYASDGYNISGFTFQGFIYNPHAPQEGGTVDPDTPDTPDNPDDPDVPETQTKKRKGYNFVLFNRRKRASQWTRKHF